MIEISEDVRDAYRQARSYPDGCDWVILADFARDQLAGRLEAEHFLEVWEIQDARDHGLGPANEYDDHVADCKLCRDPDYQREAERLLSDDKAPGSTKSKN